MSNIELYCLPSFQLEKLIDCIAEDEELAAETVFTISSSSVIDVKRIISPFIRIIDDKKETAEKVKKFIRFNISKKIPIEILILSEFDAGT
ncbi:MAG: hypothetical protein PHG24_02985 [Candidatus Pacebacteria bacterium]|nr:hypothetical protein [Candidatus Paceibacterota bacterium]